MRLDLPYIQHTWVVAQAQPGVLDLDGGGSLDPPALGSVNLLEKGAAAAHGMFSVTSPRGITRLPTPLLSAHQPVPPGPVI